MNSKRNRLRHRIEDGEFYTKLSYPSREEFETDIVAARAMREAYRKDDYRLRLLFRKAMEEEYNFSGHRSADKVWIKAWEDGHSSGLTAVLDQYDELIDLFCLDEVNPKSCLSCALYRPNNRMCDHCQRWHRHS